MRDVQESGRKTISFFEDTTFAKIKINRESRISGNRSGLCWPNLRQRNKSTTLQNVHLPFHLCKYQSRSLGTSGRPIGWGLYKSIQKIYKQKKSTRINDIW